jgi:RNA polymerase sigma factor, sigma-70 family
LILFFVFPDEAEKNKFEYIYEKYKKLMLYKAHEILHDYSLAEDAVSEAFIRIYKNLEKIEDPDSNMSVGFIVTIVRNVSLTMVKKERQWDHEEINEEITGDVQIETKVLSDISVNRIIEITDQLGEDLKSVFLLKYAQELSHREIADILNITENNVTVRIHRAKKKMCELLTKEGYARDEK